MSIKVYPTFACLLIVAVGCIIGPARSAGAPPMPWIKIETDEFVVYSDAPAKQVIECALNYAAFRRAFGQLFIEPGTSLPPSVLIIFRSAKSFQAMTLPAELLHSENVNYSAEIDGTPLNAFPLDGDREGALKKTFEFETICALQRLGYSVPIWMSQGAGEVMATLSVSKGQCVVGELGDHRFGEMFPWKEFFKNNQDRWDLDAYQMTYKLDNLLGQSWGLMHWVLLSDSAGREHFKSLAQRLRHSTALDAIAAEMNTDANDIGNAISHHLSHTRIRNLPFDETVERARLPVLPAPEAEVLVQKANLLGASGLTAQGDAQLEQARLIAPDLPAVKEARARRLIREGRPDEAVRLYREAIGGGSKDVAAYLMSASARIDDIRVGGRDVAGEGGKPALSAVEELRQAIRLSPGNAEAYRLLGRAFFVQPKVTDADVAELSSGIVGNGSGSAIRYYRALLYSRLGRTEESHADLRAVVADPQVPDQLRGTAKMMLVSEVLKADARRIEELLKEKNYSAARVIAQAAAAEPDNENVRRVYKQLSSIIAAQEASGGSH